MSSSLPFGAVRVELYVAGALELFAATSPSHLQVSTRHAGGPVKPTPSVAHGAAQAARSISRRMPAASPIAPARPHPAVARAARLPEGPAARRQRTR